MVNTRMIKARMLEEDVSIEVLAEKIGRSAKVAYAKVAGKSAMTLDQAEKIQEALNIKDADFAYYFFSHEKTA